MQDCLSSVFSFFKSEPAEKFYAPEQVLSEKSTLVNQFAINYLQYLSQEGYRKETHSAFSKSIAHRAKELNAKLEAFNPPKCCGPFKSPVFTVCCTSKIAQVAMAAGLFGGLASVYLGFATNLPTQVVLSISGILAGLANCSGTYLGLLDATFRSHAEDKQQDLYLSIREHFQNLALILLMQHLRERKEKLLADSDDIDSTTYRLLVEKILLNEDEIQLSIKNYFVSLSGDQLSRPLGFELFEALHFIADGIMPTSEMLVNQIMTFDSPSIEEFYELQKKFERMSEVLNQLQIVNQPTRAVE